MLVKKLKNFKFHHEILMDGVAASILFLRRGTGKSARSCIISGTAMEGPRSKAVGLDPRRKNLITAIDSDGNSLRYTSRQRFFERYGEVPELEKRRKGISAMEVDLSKCNHRTVDPVKYKHYLQSRPAHLLILSTREVEGVEVQNILLQKELLCRIGEKYGMQCTIYFGDWSLSMQQKGCAPSPTVGMRVRGLHL